MNPGSAPAQRHSKPRATESSGWRERLGWVAGVLWLILLLTGYYLVHKPIGPSLVVGLVLTAYRLSAALGLVCLAGGLGRSLLPDAHGDRRLQLVAQAALGLGAFAFLWLGLGLIEAYQWWLAWGLLIGGLIGLRRQTLVWVRSLFSAAGALTPTDWLTRFLAVASAMLMLLSLSEALAPPVHFDSLVYHLSLPRDFVLAGRLSFVSDNPYWGNGLGVEMLYTWAMLMGGAQVAAVLGWLAGALCLLAVYLMALRFGPRAAWIGVAALLAGQTLWSSLSWAYADWFTALYGVSGLVLLDSWTASQSSRQAVAAGILAGFAFGAKYTAGVVVPAGLAFMLAAPSGGRRWRSVILFMAAFLLTGVPWPLKNAIATGAPLYPYFGTSDWSGPVRQSYYRTVVSNVTPLDVILIPVRASLLGVQEGLGFAASIGPLLIGLVGGVVAIPGHQRSRLRSLGAYVVTAWVTWGLAANVSPLLGQTRLYLAVFPAWAVLAAAGFSGFEARRLAQVRLGRVAAALCALTLALTGLSALLWASGARPLGTLVGAESQDEYLARRLGAYGPVMARLNEMDGKVIMLWEPRGFHCRPRCVADAWLDRWYMAMRQGLEEPAILKAWQAEGATHVLLFRFGMEFIQETDPRYAPTDWERLESVLSNLVYLDEFDHVYELYRIP